MLTLTLVLGQCDESYQGELPYKVNYTRYLDESYQGEFSYKDKYTRYIANNLIKKSNSPNIGEELKIKSNKPNIGEDYKNKSNKPHIGEENKSYKLKDGDNLIPNLYTSDNIEDVHTTRKRADPSGQQNYSWLFKQQQSYSNLSKMAITSLSGNGIVYIICIFYIFYRSISNAMLKNNAMHPEAISRR